MLSVRGMSRTFGGIAAVADVSFDVETGRVHAVIGPNGAGKTTLFNCISGFYEPSAGQVFVDGEDVTGEPPERLARRGMSRTFQNLQVCMNMTACENVMLGAHLRATAGLVPALLGMTRRSDRKLRERALELMAYVGVESAASSHAGQLSFGMLKRLEIARALAAEPRILLLDEPAAGLNDAETHALSDLIRKIADGGTTILLVEHDMKLVMSISDHIVVLDQGRKIAEGTAVQVRSDPQVIAAYLGDET